MQPISARPDVPNASVTVPPHQAAGPACAKWSSSPSSLLMSESICSCGAASGWVDWDLKLLSFPL
jgi:hypothetical protein